jgi:hypothetical protein
VVHPSAGVLLWQVWECEVHDALHLIVPFSKGRCSAETPGQVTYPLGGEVVCLLVTSFLILSCSITKALHNL